MRIDLHTHFWKKEHFDPQGTFYQGFAHRFPIERLFADEERHYRHSITGRDPIDGRKDSMDIVPDAVVVLGFMAKHSGVSVTPEAVWNYVQSSNQKDPGHNRFAGFACVDARSETLIQDLNSVYDMGFQGMKCIPVYQGVHPLSSEMHIIYQFCADKKMPILIHQAATFIDNGTLTHCRPMDLSPVANRYPSLKIVAAHLGHPFCEELVALLWMNPNMYADIAGFVRRPQEFYRALSYVQEYNVWDKIFFGTDFPFRTYEGVIQTLTHINDIDESGEAGGRAHGQFRISEKQIDRMINRDAFDILSVRI